MPSYNYSCPTCGERTERWVPMSERNKQTCHVCHKPLIIRISAVPRKWNCDKGGQA